MAEPSISVVIPVKNGERFLSEALESASGQTRRASEILVVDDGSTDGSAEIAARFPGVRVISLDCGGAPAARNRGIEASNGDFVAFLDQDDVWAPRKLEVQTSHLARNPDAAAAVCYVLPFLSPGIPPPAWAQTRWFDGPVPGWTPSCLVARRSAFQTVGMFRQDAGESDTAWFLDARRAGARIDCIPEMLARWRVHGANATGNVDECLPRLLRLCREQASRNRDTSAA